MIIHANKSCKRKKVCVCVFFCPPSNIRLELEASLIGYICGAQGRTQKGVRGGGDTQGGD